MLDLQILTQGLRNLSGLCTGDMGHGLCQKAFPADAGNGQQPPLPRGEMGDLAGNGAFYSSRMFNCADEITKSLPIQPQPGAYDLLAVANLRN